MTYAIVSASGRVIEAPVNLRSKFNGITGFHLLTDEQRAAHGWYPCEVVNESFDPETQDRNPPTIEFDGAKVTVTYDIIDKSPEAIHEARAAKVRAERNDKLTASDWTQVADAPVDKAAWATYRQALRDITAQAGFPWDVTWPTAP